MKEQTKKVGAKNRDIYKTHMRKRPNILWNEERKTHSKGSQIRQADLIKTIERLWRNPRLKPFEKDVFFSNIYTICIETNNSYIACRSSETQSDSSVKKFTRLGIILYGSVINWKSWILLNFWLRSKRQRKNKTQSCKQNQWKRYQQSSAAHGRKNQRNYWNWDRVFFNKTQEIDLPS